MSEFESQNTETDAFDQQVRNVLSRGEQHRQRSRPITQGAVNPQTSSLVRPSQSSFNVYSGKSSAL